MALLNTATSYIFPWNCHVPRGEKSERLGKDTRSKGSSTCKGTEAVKPCGHQIPGWHLSGMNPKGDRLLGVRYMIISVGVCGEEAEVPRG